MILPTLGPSLKIVSIIDISPHSTEVVNLLTQITWPAGTCFHLLVMVPERLPCMDPNPKMPSQMNETVELIRWRDWASAKILTRQLTAKLQAHNLIVESEICEKQSLDIVLERTVDLSVDLIVTSDKWFDIADGFEMVSMVSELVNQTQCSRLVIRPSAKIRPLNTILAIGGPFKSQRTVEFLRILSLPEWAKVTVVSVTEEKTSALVGATFTKNYLPIDGWQPEFGTVEECISKVIDQLHNSGVQARSTIRFGDPVEEILAAAQEQEADLIVIGACGQISNQPHNLSNIAQKIVRQAPCSVLTVR